MFDPLERVTDEGRDTYILGDFNKNWFDEEESSQFRVYASICCLTQAVGKPNIMVCAVLSTTSTCLDLVFTNRPEKKFINVE